MDKIWLKCYPEGVHEEIGELPFRNLAEMFRESVKKWPDKIAFENYGTKLSFRRLDELSDDFCSYLQHDLKMEKGERLAIVMPNILQFPVAMLGAIKAGLVLVNINPQYTPRELNGVLLNSGARAVIVLENFARNVEEVEPFTSVDYVIVTRLGDMFPPVKGFLFNLALKLSKKTVQWDFSSFCYFTDALRKGHEKKAEIADPEPDDTAFLQYTGGTTGFPKGAMLTNRNLLSNMEQCVEMYRPVITMGEERVLTALPLYHVFALTINCLLMLRIGAESDLVTDPRNMAKLSKELRRFRPTVFMGVNTLFNGLNNCPDFQKNPVRSFHLVIGGGMAVQKPIAERWKELTGSFVLEGYGLTECSPLVAVNPCTQTEYSGTIGVPVPSTIVKIVGDDGSEITEYEKPGELVVKGPQVMKGYWNRQDVNGMVLRYGWFHTGDMAVWLENGNIRLVDRKKDMILVSGFNVFPSEIEEVCAMNPKVLEVCAIGVKSGSSGERVKVFVVKKDPSLTEKELIAHCQKFLTRYKVPKIVEFVDRMPKTNVGKILRRRLREIEAEKQKKGGDRV